MSQFPYHVFLSFRGEDTRKTFTDHLYTALKRAGFRTFRDDDEIQRGENIKPELESAIQQSKISIIVLSKGYASSGWCLDELVLILEQLKRTSGHVVLPLFYDVAPSEVRAQVGGFAEAFAVHEKKFKAETNANKNKGMCKLDGWRAAVREVANLSGMVLQNEADGHESKFIDKVVKFVGDKCNRTALSVPPHPVGIDVRARSINDWLQDQSTGIVTIYGIGGIGKTTIAKFLYNSNFQNFDGSSFLANVREFSKTSDGLVRLQKQLLSDILPGREVEIYNVHEGSVKIKDALHGKRIFIVLDDLDHRRQLDALFEIQDWFCSGSKIILTTRHKQLLKAHEVYEKHEVKKLRVDQSLELFSWHAFGQNHPIQGYMEHSWKVVRYCKGLPLALEILGSSLNGRSVDIWESALEKLKNVPDSEIIETLKISFDSLQDRHDKDLFLDISCFFVGKDKDYVTTVLDGCDFHTKVGLDNLIDRCLLTINDNNELMMHQLLQEMGREIVRQESLKEPGRRSRLWDHKANIEVLRDKTATTTIEGLCLNFEHIPEKPSTLHPPGYFSGLSTYLSPTKSFSASDQRDFDTDAFAGMHKLRLLQLNNVRLIGDYKCLPRKLRWLCWHGFSLTSIPDRFSLESLVCLDMQNSNLQIVWKGTKVLRSLKVIDLSRSHLLRSTPDFSGSPSIERLILAHCTNLIEIHESIGELQRLNFLDLVGCVNLQKLPRSIERLKSLEKLIFLGCSKLFKVPAEKSKMECLAIDNINQSPSSTTAGKMKSLGSSACSLIWKPRKPPQPIGFSLASLAPSLRFLNVGCCNITDDAFPRDFGDKFSLLHELCLAKNEICSLPESIKSLTMLKTLDLFDCKRLQSLPELPLSLTNLGLVGCVSLEMVTNLPKNLRKGVLWTTDCAKLVSGCGLFKLEPIKKIGTENLKKLGLCNLESWENIHIDIYSILSSTRRKLPLQGLLEFGIFSISFPGNKIPNDLHVNFLPVTTVFWKNSNFVYYVVQYNLPKRRNCKITGLKMCIICHAHDKQNSFPRIHPKFQIHITNVTKDVKWVYCPTFIGIPDDGEDMTWLCHWEMKNQLEGGDELYILVHPPCGMQQKFGIQVVYEQQGEGKAKGIHPCQDAYVGDLSAYQLVTDFYALCHCHYWLVREEGNQFFPLPRTRTRYMYYADYKSILSRRQYPHVRNQYQYPHVRNDWYEFHFGPEGVLRNIWYWTGGRGEFVVEGLCDAVKILRGNCVIKEV